MLRIEPAARHSRVIAARRAIALAHPCARAPETLAAVFWQTEKGLKSCLTVNK